MAETSPVQFKSAVVVVELVTFNAVENGQVGPG